MDSINQINTRINKLFKNPQINFFIIMFLVLLITCYTLLSSTIKKTITLILSNPSVMVICIAIILAIGYFDIGIASLMLILFFIVLFGSSTTNQISNFNFNLQEGFKVSSSDDQEQEEAADTDAEDYDDSSNVNSIDKHIKKISKNLNQSQNKLKAKEEKEKKLDERVKNIKDVVLSTFNTIRNSNNDDYKRALLENKQAMLYEEHENNNGKSSSSKGTRNNRNNKDKFADTGDSEDSGFSSSKGNRANRNNGNNNGRKRENFQTIEVRALDPSNENDTNLLITKEILQDMLNRIEYNYESNKYLRKYIKHRVEEIIEINKLTEDE